jgi:hypothetical protein
VVREAHLAPLTSSLVLLAGSRCKGHTSILLLLVIHSSLSRVSLFSEAAGKGPEQPSGT